MTYIFQNRSLSIAIALSVLIHGILLSARFITPNTFHLNPVTSIEVVLVDSARPPTLKADTPKNAEAALSENKSGTVSSKPKNTVRELVIPQKKSEYVAQKKVNRNEKNILNKVQPLVAETGDSRSLVFKNNRRQDTYVSNPLKKTVITANTRDIGYSMYYKSLRKKIEDLGVINFPQRNGERLYGELIVSIPVFHDGTIYEKEGGSLVQKSSGNPALDNAALKIVRRAAPFGRFPSSMRSKNGGEDIWVIITRLKFTQEGVRQQVQTTAH